MKKKSSMKKASTMGETMANTPMSKDKSSSCVCASCPTECSGWGLLLLRLVVGITFVLAGWPKIMGMPQLLGLPGWVGSLVGIVEVLAGLALIGGIFVRWAGYLLAIIMAVAVLFVHMSQGWGSSRLALLLLVAALTIAWCGSGKWSLHEMCNCCKK